VNVGDLLGYAASAVGGHDDELYLYGRRGRYVPRKSSGLIDHDV
jgi:hypothetical protein